MIQPRGPEAIINQADTLSEIFRTDFTRIDRSVQETFSDEQFRSFDRVIATGDGDSYYAAASMEMAFHELAGISYRAEPALKFLEYTSDYLALDVDQNTLVVSISASGTSTRVAQTIDKAKSIGRHVTAVPMVGKIDSPISNENTLKFDVELPEKGRSPGVRTYLGSLMGLYSLALHIGGARDRLTSRAAEQKRQAVCAMADMAAKTIDACMEPAAQAAKACKDAPFISVAGSGPSHGTAMYSAAKTIEAAGLYTVPQDLEEWGHIERFAYPLDFPVFIVAPPGKSHWRARMLAKAVKLLGHPLMAVISNNDQEIAELADIVFPVQGDVEESVSPLIYAIPGTLFAYHMSLELGRCILMTDNEHVHRIRDQLSNQTKL